MPKMPLVCSRGFSKGEVQNDFHYHAPLLVRDMSRRSVALVLEPSHDFDLMELLLQAIWSSH
jgi:hypothetical protein